MSHSTLHDTVSYHVLVSGMEYGGIYFIYVYRIRFLHDCGLVRLAVGYEFNYSDLLPGSAHLGDGVAALILIMNIKNKCTKSAQASASSE